MTLIDKLTLNNDKLLIGIMKNSNPNLPIKNY